MAEYRAYVGLDVHKDTIAAAVAWPGREEPEYRSIVPNRSRSLQKLIHGLQGPHGEALSVAYEAGPCGYGVYREITGTGHDCQVVAPGLIPRKPADRIKTDRRDAMTLARLHRAGELTPVWVPGPDQEAVRDLTRAREDMKALELKARQRLGAFLLRHGRVYGCWRPCKIRQLWPSKVVHLGRVIEARSRRWIRGFVRLTGPCSTLASPFSTGGVMIGREKRVLLRHYLEQGMTKAAIARHVGVSRDTIYRWIATGQLDRDLDEEAVRYRARPPVPSKLDPYKAIIEARLAGYPKLTATRLFKEVRDAGYPGSYSQVKRYVRRVRPRPPEEPVQRFETPPGHQGQVDFADFRLPWGKRHALIVVLGYSRLMWLRYYERQTMPVVMRGLETAFRYFGGVPSELLFDQMKAVIIEDGRAEGGRLVENPEFLRFSHHWGFRIRACRPYRAQTKGKVERPIRYIRESFFYGRDFVSDDDLNAQALEWLDGEANVRVHGTLKERPADRFQQERPHLTPLTPWPYRPVAPMAEPGRARRTRTAPVPPVVDVEHRPLAAYARITGDVQ